MTNILNKPNQAKPPFDPQYKVEKLCGLKVHVCMKGGDNKDNLWGGGGGGSQPAFDQVVKNELVVEIVCSS